MTAASNADILAPAEFRVGRVLSRSFGIFRRHLFKFFVLTMIAMAPTVLFMLRGASVAPPTTPNGMPQISGSMIAMAIGTVFLWMVLYMLSQAVVLFGAFQDMRGKPFSLGTSLKLGISRLLPIIALSISMMVAIGIGFALLIVPGLILMSVFFVALPACVVERLGPFKSMGRSAALTKGYRWRIFGTYLLFMFVLGIAGAIVQAAIAGIALGVAGIAGVIAVTNIMSFAWNALVGALASIVVVVIYHDLRVLKEGVDADRIAAVFD